MINPGLGEIPMLEVDHDAIAIGQIYKQAQTSGADSRIFYSRDAGMRLLRKKESLGHGLWLEWLDMNEEVLGFNAVRARSLIHGAEWMTANWQVADTLEDIITSPSPPDQDRIRASKIRQQITRQFALSASRGTLWRRESNEWYTPPRFIALAREVLGDIDVDPASTATAQQIVRARQYFDKYQNGLTQYWHGRIWLNPPYSRPLISKFIGKLLMEWNAGRVTACIALTHSYTDSMWFHDAASAACAMCFTQGRIRFYDPGGDLANATQGQIFFYFGSEVESFKRRFERIGSIVRPDSSPWSRIRDEAQAAAPQIN
jgi:ParB family chromosome partitioning protein